MAFVPPKSIRELPFKKDNDNKEEASVKVLPPQTSIDFDFYDFVILSGGIIPWL